jgi:hypothetical protein
MFMVIFLLYSSFIKINKKKKIANSREKTEKKSGGQPGHQGHCKKKQIVLTCLQLTPMNYHFNRQRGIVMSKVNDEEINKIAHVYNTEGCDTVKYFSQNQILPFGYR